MPGRTHRTAPRRLLLAGAAVVAAVAIAVAVDRPAGAQTGSPGAMHMSMATSPQELALRNAMRKLWEQHVAWTRLSIVSFTFGNADLGPTEARLLQNQTDIGNAIKPFYGAAAGHRLAQLLRRHILVAVAILGDVKSGDHTRLVADQKAWYRNANAIAAFLHRANPKHWPLRAMRQMMHRHLALTTQEAVAELTGDYAHSIAAYDAVETEILNMADMLSEGIVAQFPNRF